MMRIRVDRAFILQPLTVRCTETMNSLKPCPAVNTGGATMTVSEPAAFRGNGSMALRVRAATTRLERLPALVLSCLG
jgi:hypothetical protein